jgi:hypothetical protein
MRMRRILLKRFGLATAVLWVGGWARLNAQLPKWEFVPIAPREFQMGCSPGEQVSWYDVQEFLSAMNGRNDGYFYRLLTEAEWEFAARAGTSAAALRRRIWPAAILALAMRQSASRDMQ